MKIISVRKSPSYMNRAIAYIQQAWPEVAPVIYQECIENCLTGKLPLPQWYLLEMENELIGCAGLITNDFISRMDLYPWLCALYISPSHRGNHYAELLINQAKKETKDFGFDSLYLSTDHVGYYERLGFTCIAEGHHPWNERSKIYQIAL